MPKFLYTIIVLSIGLWGLWTKLLFTTKPEGFKNIFTFLATLFAALLLSLSIPIYFYFYKRAPTFTNLKFLYRKSVRWAFLISVGIVGILTLRALNLGSLINAGLFLIVYAMILLQMRKRR